MQEKVLLEFFPDIVVEIPVAPGGGCCLKPVVRQSKSSRKMYLLAQHIQWLFKKRVNLVIPSKSDSRIIPVKKFKQFKANWRKKRLGIHKTPALILAGKVLCQGNEIVEKEIEEEIEKKARRILRSAN